MLKRILPFILMFCIQCSQKDENSDLDLAVTIPTVSIGTVLLVAGASAAVIVELQDRQCIETYRDLSLEDLQAVKVLNDDVYCNQAIQSLENQAILKMHSDKLSEKFLQLAIASYQSTKEKGGKQLDKLKETLGGFAKQIEQGGSILLSSMADALFKAGLASKKELDTVKASQCQPRQRPPWNPKTNCHAKDSYCWEVNSLQEALEFQEELMRRFMKDKNPAKNENNISSCTLDANKFAVGTRKGEIHPTENSMGEHIHFEIYEKRGGVDKCTLNVHIVFDGGGCDRFPNLPNHFIPL